MTSARCARHAALAFGLLAGGARSAHADPPVAVRQEGCADLRAAEVERLLNIQLTTIAAESASFGAPSVLLRCADDAIEITVSDPITSKRLVRSFRAPRAGGGREREVALAVSQLFLASWVELLLSDAPAAAPPPAAAPTARVRDAAVRAVTPIIQRPGPHVAFGLAAGGRARDLAGTPYPTAVVAVRTSVTYRDSVRILSHVALEFGRASRALGDVDAQLVELGLGVGWRSPRWGPFTFDASLEAAVIAAWLRGRPTSNDASGATVSGLGAQAHVAVGPTLHVAQFAIGLEGQFGAATATATGDVSGGPTVVAGGLWAGGLLFTTVELR